MELNHPNTLLYTRKLIWRSDSTKNLGGCQHQFKAFHSKRPQKKASTGISLSQNSSVFFLISFGTLHNLIFIPWSVLLFELEMVEIHLYLTMRIVMHDPVGILKICEYLTVDWGFYLAHFYFMAKLGHPICRTYFLLDCFRPCDVGFSGSSSFCSPLIKNLKQ